LIIDGIPFMNLDELIKFKLSQGREKDMRDIELYRTPFLKLKVNQLIAFYPFPILFANSRGDILSEV
jgi:hypothetical protein